MAVMWLLWPSDLIPPTAERTARRDRETIKFDGESDNRLKKRACSMDVKFQLLDLIWMA